MYQGVEDLVELCQRASRDKAWGDAIRAAGRQRSLAEHTFWHRTAALIDLLS